MLHHLHEEHLHRRSFVADLSGPKAQWVNWDAGVQLQNILTKNRSEQQRQPFTKVSKLVDHFKIQIKIDVWDQFHFRGFQRKKKERLILGVSKKVSVFELMYHKM